MFWSLLFQTYHHFPDHLHCGYYHPEHWPLTTNHTCIGLQLLRDFNCCFSSNILRISTRRLHIPLELISVNGFLIWNLSQFWVNLDSMECVFTVYGLVKLWSLNLFLAQFLDSWTFDSGGLRSNFPGCPSIRDCRRLCDADGGGAGS